ncbi:26S proteasome regulatory subunit [Exophiala xenobiotica]|nr:26S proteasome regulatory subunit [Exophiala xenobiotica]
MSGKIDPEVISNFLAEQRDEAPTELQHIFLTFEDLWERKLWHQLTDTLLEYFSNPESTSQRLPIYNTFIISFADKINQLKLVKLALSASAQIKDDTERSQFLKTLAARVDKPDSEEAHVYTITELGSVYLRLGEKSKAREQLDQAQKTLDQFDFVENVVHAAFYRVNADYFQAEGDYTSYYRNSLLYLACIAESDLTPEQRQHRGYDLAIAALVSDTIYNFGELLLHPILDDLKPPHPQSWLRDLLFAFNRGDLAAFDRMSNNLSKNEILESHRLFLWQKINLAALTELVFKRPPHDRAMTFKTISQETNVKPDEIEHLIMKALSLGLLRGKIDQVAGIAKINWVQPKVLERTQIEGMRQRLKEWDSNVNDLGHWIEGVGKDVWAS